MRPASDTAEIRLDRALRLEVLVTPTAPKRVRRAHLAAATLDLEIVDEPSDRMVKGLASGAGQVSLARAEGAGTIWLRPADRCVRVFEVTGPITLLDPDAIIAIEPSIEIVLGDRLDRTLGLARTQRNAWNLTGTGLIALGTIGCPDTLVVSTDGPLVVESHALVAYSTGIEVTATDDYRSRMGTKALKNLIGRGFDKLGVPVDVDGRKDPVWVVVEGTGVVVIHDVVT